MKLAIISVTNKGARLAEKLANALGHPADVYAKACRNPQGFPQVYECLRDLVDKVFHRYDGLIFIMATGIVVRVLAPHIHDKRFDPAVVVVDEAGEHAISLLSGHIGGANDLAREVASTIGARPVITTATDVANLPAADVLAVKLDLTIEPFEQLKHINAAIVNGEQVAFFIDQDLANASHYIHLAAEMGVVLRNMGELVHTDNYDAAVVITDKELYMVKPHVYLRPATLAVGIGCRRGTPSAEILTALGDACRKIGRSMKSIAVIASSVVKQDEVGLLAAVQQLEVPYEFFTNEQLQQCIENHGLAISKFVEEKIGVGNVCEPAALCGGQTQTLLLPKTVYPNVTVAIAEVKYRWWE